MTPIQKTKKYLKEQIENVDLELDYLVSILDNGKIKEDNPLLVRAWTRLSLFKAVYNQVLKLEAEGNGI